uniref:Rho family-interacting cell polarization regulator 2 n=1 Tax=Erpetoichthys calabaricus TaxID=27687 RepID=A0A8C4TM63_ERPCA
MRELNSALNKIPNLRTKLIKKPKHHGARLTRHAHLWGEAEGLVPEVIDFDITSVALHSPGGPDKIIRSQSFSGFSTLQEKKSRCHSFLGISTAHRKTESKPKKLLVLGHRSSNTLQEYQPKRVQEIYEALKDGLNEYLENNQVERDKLSLQLKDMKRNSRLVSKNVWIIKSSKMNIITVDELYEAFCIQKRLYDGACKMKLAFSVSPCTKRARESLAEISRLQKEYRENMCTIEGELQNLLGEFHIKMKGLAGFARLCPGDQYEIFMHYGRQRWKMKGKIEVNAKQTWDGEDMVFLPMIRDRITIKVVESKGLTAHVLVGCVICETKNLFTSQPQTVAVDINDLGTIKLNLEVIWYPFDLEEFSLPTGNVKKVCALQRRISIYSHVTPESPTFSDMSFFPSTPNDSLENGIAANSLSDFSMVFNEPTRRHSIQLSIGTETTVSLIIQEDMLDIDDTKSGEFGHNETSLFTFGHCPLLSNPMSHDLHSDSNVSDCLLQDTDDTSELKPVELDTDEGNITKQLVQRLASNETLVDPSRTHYDGLPNQQAQSHRCVLSGKLEESIYEVCRLLESLQEMHPELQALKQEVMRLEDLQFSFSTGVTFLKKKKKTADVENADIEALREIGLG